MIYFTADPHFNHARIIPLSRRPFRDVAHMNESLIANWNATVKEYHDEVYVLGDFAFWYKDAQPLDEIFYQLNGEKHLVVGNHDEQNSKVLRLPWKSIERLRTIRYGEHRIVACHFPLERWWHMERGVLHVHGHCHGGAPERAHRFDVGVDCNDFCPVSATTIIERAAAQAFVPEDYHV